jgi:hypothetical protein
MTARRRRALASAVAALLVAVLCAALSSNVEGGQRNVLLALTVVWLVIAASCVGNALRTAHPADEPASEEPSTEQPAAVAPPTAGDEGPL